MTAQARSRCLATCFVVGLVTLVAGCSPTSSPAAKIVGTWEVDPATATGAVLQKAKVRLEIEASGQFAVASTLPLVGEVTKRGTWKYVSAEGNQTRLEVKLGDADRGAPLDIEILDENTIELIPPHTPIQAKARFRRK